MPTVALHLCRIGLHLLCRALSHSSLSSVPVLTRLTPGQPCISEHATRTPSYPHTWRPSGASGADNPPNLVPLPDALAVVTHNHVHHDAPPLQTLRIWWHCSRRPRAWAAWGPSITPSSPAPPPSSVRGDSMPVLCLHRGLHGGAGCAFVTRASPRVAALMAICAWPLWAPLLIHCCAASLCSCTEHCTWHGRVCCTAT